MLIGASGTASLGVLPFAGLGFAVRAIASTWSLMVVGLEAAFETGSPTEFRGGEVGFQMLSVSARVGLAAFRSERFELIPFMGLRGGLILTSPRGLRAVESDERSVLVAGAGALARARLGGSFFAEALPEVGAVFFRRQFQIRDGADGLHDAHQVGPVEARFSLGLGYEFR